jgi:hypothetical protein
MKQAATQKNAAVNIPAPAPQKTIGRTVRFPVELWDAFEDFRWTSRLGVSEALEQLLKIGLEVEGKRRQSVH